MTPTSRNTLGHKYPYNGKANTTTTLLSFQGLNGLIRRVKLSTDDVEDRESALERRCRRDGIVDIGDRETMLEMTLLERQRGEMTMERAIKTVM
jgi:hypothetical protein